uniref:Uncharacterized protein n=1 Tax=Romanomermis culicivorax TaxID=13658 RepID=A0A915KEX1_ROMCU
MGLTINFYWTRCHFEDFHIMKIAMSKDCEVSGLTKRHSETGAKESHSLDAKVTQRAKDGRQSGTGGKLRHNHENYLRA